jgi:uncharacterized protein YciI
MADNGEAGIRAHAILAFDGADPSRRAAARQKHIDAIGRFAADGTLLLGLPLHTPEGRSRGSVMIISAANEDGVADYLAREPFAADGVWQEIACRPIRIPALPLRSWPGLDCPMPSGRGHTILVGEGAAELRRLARWAAAGTVCFAAETLDAPGAILVTTHAEDAAARAWAEAEPALGRCRWTLHATLFRPLPYRPLPGMR